MWKTIRGLFSIPVLVMVLFVVTCSVAVAQEVEPLENTQLNVALDTMWVLLTGFLVFFMQAGFGFLEAGFIPSKHVANILIENFIDTAITGITFWAVGFGLAFGVSNGLFGRSFFFLNGLGETQQFLIPGFAFFFFQFAFSAAASTITSGACAGRVRFVSDLLYSAILSAIVYPIVVHWVWGGGWLSQLGFKDFAGSTVVHSLGGWAGLMGTLALGARLGRFNKDGTANPIPGHNISLAALGAFILWFAWYGFNPGSTLSVTYPGAVNDIALVTLNTTLAACAGAVAALLVYWILSGVPDISQVLNGSLAGLVAVTAPCAYVAPWAALVIGTIAGGIVVLGALLLERIKIDDPVGAIPVHGMNGVWGTLSVGLFAVEGGLLYGGGVHQLGVQLLGSLAVFGWTAVTMGAVFFGIKALIGLRVDTQGEVTGLDLTEHSVVSYPEFGTTIIHTVSGETAMAPGAGSVHG